MRRALSARVVAVWLVGLASVLVALTVDGLSSGSRAGLVFAIALLTALGSIRPGATSQPAEVDTEPSAQTLAAAADAVRVATARMSMVLDDFEAPLALLADDLAKSPWAGCRFDVRDGVGTVRTVASAPKDHAVLGADLDATMAKVADEGVPTLWRGGGATPLRHGTAVLGAMAFVTRDAAAPTDGDVAVADDVAEVVASTIERVQFLVQTRVAVRRSQRIARQLHQLIAAAIAVAGLRGEADILTRLARSVRSVFDADEAVVSLDEGSGAPLGVLATRSGERSSATGEPDRSDWPIAPQLGADLHAVRDGQWLVVPILVRRGVSRGSVSVRRTSGTGFSEDDVEVLALLAQMASSSLDASAQDRTILRAQARWRVLVEAAPVGLVEVDANGGIRWWNAAASSILAWPDTAATTDAVAFPDDVAPALAALRDEALAGGASAVQELARVRVGDQVRDLTAAAAAMEHGDGEPSALLLIDDVTEQRRLVDELHHSQRMEVIGQLASSVAHDFNNLLTLIAGYAELLSHSVDGDERATQLTMDIQAATARASTLTGKLLTIGRTKTPAPIAFSPATTIDSIGEVLARILGTAIELRLELDPAAGVVRADPDQFEQTVLNLAINARDAMPEGGTLTISLAPVEIGPALAEERGLVAGPHVQLLIVDTGEGMDAETARRCFEPLFTTKGPSKGTGLGLPAARRVVNESGGSIVCRSRPAEGTTFDILLPRSQDAVAHAPRPDAQTTPGAPATVLVAEDEDGIRALVTRVLSHNGYTVLEAASGEEALELAQAHDGPLDLLVSDVVMGQMSGRELAFALQATHPGLLVVLASGNVDATILEGLRSGSASFLPKPFRPSEMLAAVGELQARGRGVVAGPDGGPATESRA